MIQSLVHNKINKNSSKKINPQYFRTLKSRNVSKRSNKFEEEYSEEEDEKKSMKMITKNTSNQLIKLLMH